MSESPRNAGPRRDWQTIGAASGLGSTVVVSLLLCIGGGILLDRKLDTAPWLTLIGMALGMFCAGYALYELAVLGKDDKGIVKLHRADSGESSRDGSRKRTG